MVKGSATFIVKAPVQGGWVARALNPELLEVFQQSIFKVQVREGVSRVPDQLVHNSLIG